MPLKGDDPVRLQTNRAVLGLEHVLIRERMFFKEQVNSPSESQQSGYLHILLRYYHPGDFPGLTTTSTQQYPEMLKRPGVLFNQSVTCHTPVHSDAGQWANQRQPHLLKPRNITVTSITSY